MSVPVGFQVIAKFAALIFAIASSVAVLFQVALALGAPWGEFTLGGRWRGRLPGAVRLIPLVSIALLGLFCWVVLARAGFQVLMPGGLPPWVVWVAVAYCALGCIANAISPSRRERQLWLPIVATMLLTSIVVAAT
ncbi:hypothetical protein [Hydrogenophaga soli]